MPAFHTCIVIIVYECDGCLVCDILFFLKKILLVIFSHCVYTVADPGGGPGGLGPPPF